MKLIYLASPYSPQFVIGKRADDLKEKRAQAVIKAAAHLMRHTGHAVFAPIAHTHEVGKLLPEFGHEFWMNQDLAVLRRCDALYVLKLLDWEISQGVREEIAFARKRGIPVHFLTEDTYELHYAPPFSLGSYDPPKGVVTPVAVEGNAPMTATEVMERNALRSVLNNPEVRKFETGATRSADVTRDDPEGYLSPIVLERFAQYMTKHRRQPDGSLRESDNWQKGMPLTTYIKGMWRHMLHAWTRHRGYKVNDPLAAADIEEDLCAIMFNAQGYLFELLKKKQGK